MKIMISIDSDGNSTVAVTGAPGKACLKATDGLDQALGKLGKRVLTPEYNQPQKEGQKVKQ